MGLCPGPYRGPRGGGAVDYEIGRDREGRRETGNARGGKRDTGLTHSLEAGEEAQLLFEGRNVSLIAFQRSPP